MPRKYEVPISTCRICDADKHPGDVPDESCEHDRETCAVIRTVTTYDARDVEPLAAALRDAAARTVDDRTRDELTAALKAFEEDSDAS